jgi:hypothetical protein
VRVDVADARAPERVPEAHGLDDPRAAEQQPPHAGWAEAKRVPDQARVAAGHLSRPDVAGEGRRQSRRKEHLRAFVLAPVAIRQKLLRIRPPDRERRDVDAERPQRDDLALDEGVRDAGVPADEVRDPQHG